MFKNNFFALYYPSGYTWVSLKNVSKVCLAVWPAIANIYI